MADPDYRQILLQLIGSLTLADHMGDAAGDVAQALKMAGLDIEWDDLNELGARLGQMGVTTLHGTPLSSDDDCDLAEENRD